MIALDISEDVFLFIKIKVQKDLFPCLDKFGFKAIIQENGNIFIKINLA